LRTEKRKKKKVFLKGVERKIEEKPKCRREFAKQLASRRRGGKGEKRAELT